METLVLGPGEIFSFNDRVGPFWHPNIGQVYQLLHELERRGLVARRDEETRTRLRRIFRLTARGERALRTWLATPVDHLRDVRSALLLKLAFIDRLGLDNLALIDAQQTALADRLRELTQPPDNPPDVAALWRHHSASAVDQFLRSVRANADPSSGEPRTD